MTVPLKPALQAHPDGTSVPELLTGQATALQVLIKKGDKVEEVMLPLNPALQSHPTGALTPLLLAGHDTATHPLLK